MYSSRMKSILRRSFQLLRLLPRSLRAPITRSQLNLSYEIPDGVIIKVAEEKEEFEQAYRILHDAYLETRLIDKEESGLRVTKYHALPSTSLCVIKHYEQVVGTFTIVQDNPLGLPIDSRADISFLRRRNARIAEISALAIAKDSGLRRGILLFPMMHFIYAYARKIAGIEALVAVVNQSANIFYQDILDFSPLKPLKGKDYQLVKTKHACPLYLEFNFDNTNCAIQKLKMAYGRKRPEQNLYQYLFEHDPKQFIQLPDTPFPVFSHNRINPQLLREFFQERSKVFAKLEPIDKQRITQIYTHPDLIQGLEESLGSMQSSRESIRFPLQFLANAYVHSEQRILSLKVTEGSLGGLQVFCSEALHQGDTLDIQVRISEKGNIRLRTQVCWIDQKLHRYGLKIVDPIPQLWEEYQMYLMSYTYPSLRSPYILQPRQPSRRSLA